jgi:hypothetical protein
MVTEQRPDGSTMTTEIGGEMRVRDQTRIVAMDYEFGKSADGAGEVDVRRIPAGGFVIALMTVSLVAAQGTPPAAAAASAPAASAAKTSEEFSAYTYKEQSGEITVLVYSWPANWRAMDNFFPVFVAVGRTSEKHKKGETPAEKKDDRASMIIDLDNFELTDAQGNLYHPATYEQIQAQYKFLMSDKSMIAAEPMVTGNLFNESAFLGAPFYPVSGGGRLRANAVELEPWSYFMSAIYFQRPDSGLGGVMTLTLKGDKIDPPINVRFELPQPHAKKEKHK